MKIVFLSYPYWPPDFGGELLLTLERLETLASRGHKILVLTCGKQGISQKASERGYHILRSPVVGEQRWQRGLRRVVFWWWGLFQLMRLDYNVLHLGSTSGFGKTSEAIMAWSLALIARLKQAKRIWVHSLAEQEHQVLNLDGLNRLWYRIFFMNLSQVVAVSPRLSEPIRAIAPKKSILLLNGVRDDIFKPFPDAERTDIRDEEGIPTNGVIFVFLGTVGYRKGFDLLAKAFTQLAPSHPDWRLWVIGPYRPAENQNILESEVRQVIEPLIPVIDRVKFWGRVDDRYRLAQLLGAGDFFVFPSRREGFGLAPVEAMACGTPVIIARLPGITDLANIDGQTGLYIKPDSVEDLCRAMLQLGENTILREEMGRAGRERVKENFGWESHVNAWEDLYKGGNPPV